MKNIFSAIFVLVVLLLTGNVMAQSLDGQMPSDPDLLKGVLPNGLTYYIRKNPTPANKVELRLVVKAGSILEDADQKGLAHFMEHMNFNGTKNFPENELVSYLETIGLKFGADLNANTNHDLTQYILSVPTDKPDNLEKGFQVLEDWAHNALLTDAQIDAERGVVLEEIRLGKTAARREQVQIFPELYKISLYAYNNVIGSDNSIQNFKYDAVRRFYHDWYRPDLMAVIVIGDMDTAKALQMIQSHFAGLTNPEQERTHFYADIQERDESAAMVVTDKEEIVGDVSIVFPFKKADEGNTIGDYRNRLKEIMLLQLLRARYRDAFKSSTDVVSVFFNNTVHGYKALQLSVRFGNKGVDNQLAKLTDVLLQVRKYGFFASEVETVRAAMISRMESSLKEQGKKNSSSYVAEYVRNFSLGEPIEGPSNEYYYYKTLLPQIRPDELSALLSGLTYQQKTFTYITAPGNGETKLPSSEELQSMVEEQFNKQPTYAVENKHATELPNNKPAAGKIVARQEEAGLDATTYTLSNGIKITIKKTDFQNDEIKMLGIKRGGRNNYTDKDEIDCALADAVIRVMGYGDMSPNELNHALSGKNASVAVVMGNTLDEVKGDCRPNDLETMLQLTYLKLTDPNKNYAKCQAWEQNYKRQIDNIYANPQVYFMDTVMRALYKDDPLYMGIPDADDVKKFHLNRAIAIYKDEFSYANGYHFFVIGNVDTAVALPLLETYLGGLDTTDETPVSKDNGLRPVTGNNTVIVHKGTEKKSVVVAKYYGAVPYSEQLELNAHVMTEILNIKVIQILREKMSGIYTGGFSATVSNEPYEHYNIDLYLPCGPENVDKLIAAAKEEINKIKRNGPEAQDLEKVKTQLLERHEVNIHKNDFWLTKMNSIIFMGKSKESLLNYKAAVEKITLADIQSTANLLFDGKNEFTAILMPE